MSSFRAVVEARIEEGVKDWIPRGWKRIVWRVCDKILTASPSYLLSVFSVLLLGSLMNCRVVAIRRSHVGVGYEWASLCSI